MATYSRTIFSGSTNGRPVALSLNTNTTTLHTTGTSTTAYSEVYLWANNVLTTAINMTLQFGTTTADRVCNDLSIPANSPPIPILTGQNINGSVSLSGYASSANGIVVQGYINLIS